MASLDDLRIDGRIIFSGCLLCKVGGLYRCGSEWRQVTFCDEYFPYSMQQSDYTSFNPKKNEQLFVTLRCVSYMFRPLQDHPQVRL